MVLEITCFFNKMGVAYGRVTTPHLPSNISALTFPPLLTCLTLHNPSIPFTVIGLAAGHWELSGMNNNSRPTSADFTYLWFI